MLTCQTWIPVTQQKWIIPKMGLNDEQCVRKITFSRYDLWYTGQGNRYNWDKWVDHEGYTIDKSDMKSQVTTGVTKLRCLEKQKFDYPESW